ncbi:MAG: hypothetical protein GWP59_03760 [Chlamydiales bacterium]|nr:hypothetical protein [Chlamydiales bacterium]
MRVGKTINPTPEKPFQSWQPAIISVATFALFYLIVKKSFEFYQDYNFKQDLDALRKHLFSVKPANEEDKTLSTNLVVARGVSSISSPGVQHWVDYNQSLGAKPFYKGRKGFPNPSNQNCSFNSMGIVLAHAMETDYRFLALTRSSGENTTLTSKQHLLKQEKEALSVWETKISHFKAEYESLRDTPAMQQHIKNMETLTKKISELKAKIARVGYQAKEEGKAQLLQLQDLQGRAPEKNISESLSKMDDTLNLLKVLELAAAKSKLKIENLTREVNELQGCLQYEKSLSDQRQKDTVRFAEVIRILRGEIDGDLSEADAQMMSDLIAPYLDYLQGESPYRSSADAKIDPNCVELKKLVNSKDWRVIRAGGHGHWWTYVRNKDGKTVTEINDNAYPIQHNLDSLIRRWENPDEWNRSQITFY